MANGGLLNEGYPGGKTFTITSAVTHAGSILAATTTAKTADLAAVNKVPIGFAYTDSAPAPAIGGNAVAGEKLALYPFRPGVVFEAPVEAATKITVGQYISVGATTAGYVKGSSSLVKDTFYFGIALTAADNTAGAAGAQFVDVLCIPAIYWEDGA